ncbi:MAG: 16S rRNA (cytidine(1402)-2'-O)-methyltransferase [Alphaproteobacteria bacterium]
MPGSKRRTPPPDPAAGPGDAAAGRAPRRLPEPGLHLVATPIGDLGDITLRALDTLRHADLIACEDTRVTAVLLRHYAIATPTAPYHEHNAAKVRPRLLQRLAAGETLALVSDAGTPLISDPGYRLVVEARERGIPVHCAPGPSAVMAALSLAGLPTDAFTFAGFLPAKASGRAALLDRLAAAPGSLVLRPRAGCRTRSPCWPPGWATGRPRSTREADQAARGGAQRRAGRAGRPLCARPGRRAARWCW